MPARAAQRVRQFLDDDCAAADHVDPALVHRPQRRALVMAHGDDVVAHRQQFAEPDAGQVDRRRVIRRHPLRQRRKGGHGSRDADPRARPLDGHHPQRLPQLFAHHFPRGRHLHRRGRIGVQAAFGQADTADVGRVAGLHLALPQHHLGGSAAEIDDDERRCGDVQFADRAVKRQLGLLVAGDHLGHRARHDGAQHSDVMAKNTSRLAASRVADVATIRTFSTSWRRNSSA